MALEVNTEREREREREFVCVCVIIFCDCNLIMIYVMYITIKCTFVLHAYIEYWQVLPINKETETETLTFVTFLYFCLNLPSLSMFMFSVFL